MITVIQRVTMAKVSVENKELGRIDRGILALLAIQHQDTEKDADRLLQRLLNYRIFPDAEERMNLSLQDIGGGLLLVPQFTLAADTRKGKRPSFTRAAPPEQGRALFDYFVGQAQASHHHVACGQFAADMQVSLVNDGPVTFILETLHQ